MTKMTFSSQCNPNTTHRPFSDLIPKSRKDLCTKSDIQSNSDFFWHRVLNFLFRNRIFKSHDLSELWFYFVDFDFFWRFYFLRFYFLLILWFLQLSNSWFLFFRWVIFYFSGDLYFGWFCLSLFWSAFKLPWFQSPPNLTTLTQNHDSRKPWFFGPKPPTWGFGTLG
jgi:hypothetical protein